MSFIPLQKKVITIQASNAHLQIGISPILNRTNAKSLKEGIEQSDVIYINNIFRTALYNILMHSHLVELVTTATSPPWFSIGSYQLMFAQIFSVQIFGCNRWFVGYFIH
jgi:hypothetical protein